MLRGELRGDDQTLGSLKINKTSKLMLIGTKLEDVMAVATASETSKELEKDPSDVKVSLTTAFIHPVACRTSQATTTFLVFAPLHSHTTRSFR